MGWVRLDDNFADHPKVIALSDSAFRLFITGLCYSNRQLTDGFIPFRMVMAWAGDNPAKPSDELEEQNLWERVETGFRIRSYDEYQPTRSQVEEKRERSKERLQRYRERRNADETQMKRVSDMVVVTDVKQGPNPTHPNPTQPSIDTSRDVSPVAVALPRVKSAREAVIRVSDKLYEARKQGINSWNLSNLIAEEFDQLNAKQETGACIGLLAWYVAELQQRELSSAEIARIGQLYKRWGRIALIAIDKATIKDLTDLVSYAEKAAQGIYAERKS